MPVMRRFTQPWLLVFAVLLPLQAMAADIPFGVGLLWRVQQTGQLPSYVFGTLHSSEPSITDLPPPVAAAFAAADTVATEVILDPPAIAQLGRAMLLPIGRRLDQLMTPTQAAKLKDVAARYGMAFDTVTRFKPWAVMALFSFPPAEYARAAAGRKALDEKLQMDAQAAGKKLVGIETIDEQIDALNGLSQPDQLSLLDATLQQSNDIDQVFERLRSAYIAGNLAAVRAALDAPMGDAGPAVMRRLEGRLIVERNRRMADRLRPLLRRGNAFIVVGALHLSGEQGVLSLLANAGYQVTRIY